MPISKKNTEVKQVVKGCTLLYIVENVYLTLLALMLNFDIASETFLR